MNYRRILPCLCFATLVAFGMSSSALADVILNFAQQGGGTPLTATSSPGSTSITGDIPVTISGIAAGIPVPINAFLNIHLNSVANTASATTVPPGVTIITQQFLGTFSITQNANGSGINYLSGSGNLLAFGIAGGSSLSLQGSPSFSSSVIALAAGATSASFSLTGISGLSITNSTIASFTSSVTGTFSAALGSSSAATAPEPSFAGMLGVGGIGWLLRAYRRRRTTAVA